jgi:NAD(P)-dependent dehydrogenase (short-subunit alcohol dehydrogenase family)
VLKTTLPIMVDQGRGGAVVSIGSDAGTAGHGSPNMGAYGAAKAGLAHLVKTVACEYGKDGIRMNMVSPGATETAATAALPSETVAAMNSAIPLRRRGTPQDIANAVVFLASPLSRHVTGQILGVDGGVSVESPMPDLSVIGRTPAPL